MKNILKIALVVILIVPVIVTIIINYHNNMDQSDDYFNSGVIRIGYAVEIPYAYVGDDGSVTGESPEIAKIILKRLGIKNIKWIQTEFDSLITGLNSGKYDIIACGMFITEERQNEISFSNPSFHVKQALLCLRGTPVSRIESFEDLLELDRIKIAVLTGSVEEKIITNLGFNANNLYLVPDALSGKSAVQLKYADCLILSSPTIRLMTADSKFRFKMVNLKSLNDSLNIKNGYGAFGFRKTDTELLSKWNNIMKNYIGSSEHLDMISQFGFTSDELSGENLSVNIADEK